MPVIKIQKNKNIKANSAISKNFAWQTSKKTLEFILLAWKSSRVYIPWGYEIPKDELKVAKSEITQICKLWTLIDKFKRKVDKFMLAKVLFNWLESCWIEVSSYFS